MTSKTETIHQMMDQSTPNERSAHHEMSYYNSDTRNQIENDESMCRICRYTRRIRLHRSHDHDLAKEKI